MFKHGADLEKIKRKYHIKGELVDFSSNINPFTPEDTVIHIIDDIEDIRKYPDIDYVKLRNAVAEHVVRDNRKCDFVFNLNNICVGNGATELIYLFMRSIEGKIGIICPTFSEYRRAASVLGKDHVEIQMLEVGNSFEYPDFSSPKMDEYKDLDALFLCNPNNPDGKIRNLEKIVEFCKENSIKLVVDETFIEFCDDYENYTVLNYNYTDIYVLRAITKFYGLPGIRLGYMISRNSSHIEELLRIKEPWTINSIAANLGVELLKDDKFRESSRNFYREERKYLVEELEKIKSIKVYETDSAFILSKINEDCKYDARELKEKLVFEHGIVIRDASNFLGLNSNFFRVAVKRHNDNRILIEALNDVFNK
ncbi:MAG: aminotransferase class I/II-fold pyridoxal phosphate-dependent enzyme [Peptostreptococcus sp.]|uniref:pyridoxal phosphate-dependent aminotransferase n=1 Tax=Peptostreptococcus sp. TaxID=1262 RepID=UPI002FCAD247